MIQPPHQLDYGTRRRRRRWWWVGALVVLVLVLSVATERRSRPLREGWRLGQVRASLYQEVLRSAPPAEAVVYGVNDDVERVFSPWGSGHFSRGGQVVWTRKYWAPPQMAWLSSAGGSPLPPTNLFTIFLGERSAGAERRLVAIHVVKLGSISTETVPIELHWQVLDRFDWRGRPKSAPASGTVTIGVWSDPERAPARYHFGRASPQDGSRISIRYAIGGEEGFIDGKLEDDLTVTLTVRDGPLAK